MDNNYVGMKEYYDNDLLDNVTVSVSMAHNYNTLSASTSVVVDFDAFSAPAKADVHAEVLATTRRVLNLELNAELFVEHAMLGNMPEAETKNLLSNLKELFKATNLKVNALKELAVDNDKVFSMLNAHLNLSKGYLKEVHDLLIANSDNKE